MKSLKKFFQKHQLFLTIFAVAMIVNIPWFIALISRTTEMAEKDPIMVTLIELPYYPFLWLIWYTPSIIFEILNANRFLFYIGFFIGVPLLWSLTIFVTIKLYRLIRQKFLK